MGDQTKSGIYVIINAETGDCYIGSSFDVDKRLSQHRYLLRTGRHHSHRLQKAWNKHGEGAFIFDVLEIVEDAKDLIITEQRYLDKRRPTYNEDGIAFRTEAAIVPDSERSQEYKKRELLRSLERIAEGEQLVSLFQEIHRLRAIIRRGDDIMNVLNVIRNLTETEREAPAQFARLAALAYNKGMTSCKDFFLLINAIVTGLNDGRSIFDISSQPQSEEWAYYLPTLGFAALSVGTLIVGADISQMEHPTNQDMWDASFSAGREIRELLMKHGIKPEDMAPEPHISEAKRIAGGGVPLMGMEPPAVDASTDASTGEEREH